MSRTTLSILAPVAAVMVLTATNAALIGASPDGIPPWDRVLPFRAGDDASMARRARFTTFNALSVVAVTAVFSYLFAAFYRCEARRTMSGVLACAFAGFLVFYLGFHLRALAAATGWALDWISLIVLIVQLSAFVGVPTTMSDVQDDVARARQRTNRHVSLVTATLPLAWPFLCFPEADLWATIFAVVVWDIFAVLAPWGPLGYIMREEERRVREDREQFLPRGLLYDGDQFKLGTGDFLFYAVVVGRAVIRGWLLAVLTAVASVAGVVLTIWYCIFSSRVVPALPVALGFGLAVYFGGQWTVLPYVELLVTHGVMV